MPRWRSPGALTVWFVVVLHTTWAALMWSHPSALHITALHPLAKWNPIATALLFLIAAVVAAATLVYKKSTFWTLIGLLPQQALLFIGATAALQATFAGHFGDGAVRPWQFILADQFPYALLASAHLVSLVFLHQDLQGSPPAGEIFKPSEKKYLDDLIIEENIKTRKNLGLDKPGE